jgi:hypothetical protein
MLRSVDRFCTDVSGLRIGPKFKGQDVQTSQKKTEFRQTAAKAYDLAWIKTIVTNTELSNWKLPSLQSH